MDRREINKKTHIRKRKNDQCGDLIRKLNTMKKIIFASAILILFSLSSIAQMAPSGLPRFIKWVDNTQMVLNTKRGDDASPKNYICSAN